MYRATLKALIALDCPTLGPGNRSFATPGRADLGDLVTAAMENLSISLYETPEVPDQSWDNTGVIWTVHSDNTSKETASLSPFCLPRRDDRPDLDPAALSAFSNTAWRGSHDASPGTVGVIDRDPLALPQQPLNASEGTPFDSNGDFAIAYDTLWQCIEDAFPGGEDLSAFLHPLGDNQHNASGLGAPAQTMTPSMGTSTNSAAAPDMDFSEWLAGNATVDGNPVWSMPVGPMTDATGYDCRLRFNVVFAHPVSRIGPIGILTYAA